jgi:LPXTG-motif cell wall-anchored protein
LDEFPATGKNSVIAWYGVLALIVGIALTLLRKFRRT